MAKGFTTEDTEAHRVERRQASTFRDLLRRPARQFPRLLIPMEGVSPPIVKPLRCFVIIPSILGGFDVEGCVIDKRKPLPVKDLEVRVCFPLNSFNADPFAVYFRVPSHICDDEV